MSNLLFFNTVLDFCKTNALPWGLIALKFLVVAVVGMIAISFAVKLFRKALNKTKLSQIAIGFMSIMLKTTLAVLLLMTLLQILNIDITGFIAIVGTLGIAVALSLQSSFTNIVNGIIIVSTKPFDVGDFIGVAGVEGSVIKITMFSTYINTTDNKIIIIPNGEVITQSLTNYNGNTKRKVVLSFKTGINADVDAVKKITNEVIISNGKVYLEPTPSINLTDFEGGNQTYKISCWCDSEDYWSVYYYLIENIFNQLKKSNIDVSVSKMNVVETKVKALPYDNKALPKRVEKERKPTKEDLDIVDTLTKNIKKIKITKPKKTKKSNTAQDDDLAQAV